MHFDALSLQFVAKPVRRAASLLNMHISNNNHWGNPIMNNATTRRRLLAAACALAFTAAAAPHAQAWDWSFGRSEQVQGNGKLTRQTREVSGFKGVALSLPGNVEVRTGGSEGLSIETDENLLPLIETVVEDGTLKIRPKKNTNIRTRNLKVVVQARALERLSLGGSGNIDADALRGGQVSLAVGGSGTIKVGRIEGDSINVNVGGSGDVKALEGSARNLSVSIGGSGDVDLGHVRSDTAKVSLAGSGDATLWVRNQLSISTAGSGNVDYYGDPQVSKSSVGSGTARRLGAAPN
jgi:hypothetical protein